MFEISGVAHFSIPVSNLDRSIDFYTTVVGCKLVRKMPDRGMVFLDAAGLCVILFERKNIPNPIESDHNGVHHAFIIAPGTYRAALTHLRNNNVNVFFEEDRQGGVINGPRAYFRDPDGTVLEFIDRTGYVTN